MNGTVKFSFKQTNPVIVTDIANLLPASKAVGYDIIPIRLVKDSISVVATLLSILFNASIARNSLPTCWKFGQVIQYLSLRRVLNISRPIRPTV